MLDVAGSGVDGAGVEGGVDGAPPPLGRRPQVLTRIFAGIGGQIMKDMQQWVLDPFRVFEDFADAPTERVPSRLDTMCWLSPRWSDVRFGFLAGILLLGVGFLLGL